ncbi:MAG: T9SS type A sorting domain-containing protein, partial [Lewinella sp.]
PGLTNVLGYTTGVEANDLPFRDSFPFVALPHSGVSECSGMIATTSTEDFWNNDGLGLEAPNVIGRNFPNPFQTNTTLVLRVREKAAVNIDLYDVNGRNLSNLVRRTFDSGDHQVPVQVGNLPEGIYFAVITGGRGEIIQTLRLVKTN